MKHIQQVDGLLGRLEALINEATRIPLTNKVMLEAGEAFELVEMIRQTLPEEMREAVEIVKEREHILARARMEGEAIVARAEEAVSRMVDETVIAAEAQHRAEALLDKSRTVAQEIHHRSIRYADEILQQIEARLGETLRQIHQHREELRK